MASESPSNTDYESTRRFYQSRGLGGTSGFGTRPAVIVVDMIRGFIEPKYKLAGDFETVIDSLLKLLRFARRLGFLIVFTTVLYQTPLEGGAFLEKVPALREFTPESRLVEVDARLERRRQEPLLIKKYASAFFGTSLAPILVSSKVDTVIVTGVTTSGCVRATTIDALQNGYKVIVPRECVGDRSAQQHESNLFDINAKYGDVVSIESVLNWIAAMSES